MSSPVDHPAFCFDDSLIAIQVENVRFKVHKYQLMKSETFADMFDIAKGGRIEGKLVEGSSLENPVKLEGVSASDFACLLTVLYANLFSTNHPDPNAALIIPAFRLANMWNFSDLRACLLPLAERVLDDVDKIVFAREFGIKDWLAYAHVNLCQRPTHLSIGEARKLGINSVLMISTIREEFPPSDTSARQSQSCSGAPLYCCYDYGSNQGSGHCLCCSHSSDTSSHTQGGVTQTIRGKVDKWVENNCVST